MAAAAASSGGGFFLRRLLPAGQPVVPHSQAGAVLPCRVRVFVLSMPWESAADTSGMLLAILTGTGESRARSSVRAVMQAAIVGLSCTEGFGKGGR